MLKPWFLRHGYPLVLLSDQGRNVDGVLVRELCNNLNISKLHSSPYHPQGDGQAERSIETFKQTMRCLLQDRRVKETDWHTLVQEVTFNCNSQINVSTGVSPHEVMYGVRLRTRSDAVLPYSDAKNFDDIPTYCAQSKHVRKGIIDGVTEKVTLAQERMKRNYNRGTKETEVVASARSTFTHSLTDVRGTLASRRKTGS